MGHGHDNGSRQYYALFVRNGSYMAYGKLKLYSCMWRTGYGIDGRAYEMRDDA